MKQCEMCVNEGRVSIQAVCTVTVTEIATGEILLENNPVCEDHAESVDAFVQLVNLPLKGEQLSITVQRIKP